MSPNPYSYKAVEDRPKFIAEDNKDKRYWMIISNWVWQPVLGCLGGGLRVARHARRLKPTEKGPKEAYDRLDPSDRAKLLEVMKHREEIEPWRANLPLNERLSSAVYLTAAQLRTRYGGVSHMWIERIPRSRAASSRSGRPTGNPQAFGVQQPTIVKWRTNHPEFAEALRFRDEDRIFQNDAVKRALFHRANGYSFHSEKVFVQEGRVTRVPVVEHVPPATDAAKFWLTNQDRKNWAKEVNVNVSSTASVDIKITKGMDPNDAMAEFMKMFRAPAAALMDRSSPTVIEHEGGRAPKGTHRLLIRTARHGRQKAASAPRPAGRLLSRRTAAPAHGLLRGHRRSAHWRSGSSGRIRNEIIYFAGTHHLRAVGGVTRG